MPFPISICGTIVVPKARDGLATTDQAAVRIQDMLDSAVAGNICREGNSISFTAGFGRLVGSWNILASIDRGVIELGDAGPDIRVNYTLRTVQLLIIVSSLVCVVAFVPIFLSRTNSTWPTAPLWQFILMWAFLFGANYLTTVVRFPRWLERGLRRDRSDALAHTE